MAGEDNFKAMAENIKNINAELSKLRTSKGLSDEAAMTQLILDGNTDILALAKQRAILAEKNLDTIEKMPAEQKAIFMASEKIRMSQKSSQTFLENATKKQMGATRKQQNMSKATMEIVWRGRMKEADAEEKHNIMMEKQVVYKDAITRAEKNAQGVASTTLGLARQTAEMTEQQAGQGLGGAAVNLAAKSVGTAAKFITAGVVSGEGGVAGFMAAGAAAVGAGGVALGTALAIAAIPVAIMAAKLYVLPSKLTGYTRAISSMTSDINTAGHVAGSWMSSLAASDVSNKLMIGTSDKVANSLTRSLRFDPNAIPTMMTGIRNVGAAFGYAPTGDEMTEFGNFYKVAAKLQGKAGSGTDYLARTTKDLAGAYVHTDRIAKKMNVPMSAVLGAASGLADGMQQYNVSMQDATRLVGMFTTGNGSPVRPTTEGAAQMGATMAGAARGLSPAMAMLAMGGKGGLGDYYKYQFKSAPEQIGMMQNMIPGLFTAQKGDNNSMLGMKTMLQQSMFGLDPYTAAQSVTARMPGAVSKKEEAAATKKIDDIGKGLDAVMGTLQNHLASLVSSSKGMATSLSNIDANTAHLHE